MQDLIDELTTQKTQLEAAHQVRVEQHQHAMQKVAMLTADRDEAQAELHDMRERLNKSVEEAAGMSGKLVVAKQEAVRQARQHRAPTRCTPRATAHASN